MDEWQQREKEISARLDVDFRKGCEDLYELLSPRVTLACWRRLGPSDTQDVLEAVQETFARLFTKLARGERPSVSYRALTYGIAKYVCFEVIRRRKRDGKHLNDASAPEMEPRRMALASVVQSLSNARKRETWEVIEHCLERQPPNSREALRLRFLEELSYQELGEKLGISTTTAFERIAQAVQPFRDCIERKGGLEPGVF